MLKVVSCSVIVILSFFLSTPSYADGPMTVFSIFGDDMDDADDRVLLVEQQKAQDRDLIEYFSGPWRSLSKEEDTTITFSDNNNYTYTNIPIVEGYYNPSTYHGTYIIRGTKEKGNIEVNFDNGDYMVFPYVAYGMDEYLIDKKFYKKQKHL